MSGWEAAALVSGAVNLGMFALYAHVAMLVGRVFRAHGLSDDQR